MTFRKSLISLFFILGIVFPVHSYEIVATVNDEVISDYDVSTRLKMMEVLLKLSPAMVNNEQTKEKILDTLIDEQVKLQEATKKNIELTAEEVEQGITYLEEQNQMSPGTLRKIFSENQIDFDTLERQIKSDLSWLKVLRSENEKPPVVTEAEIKAEQKKLKEELVKPAYLIAEIYIPYGQNQEAAQKQINDLFDQIEKAVDDILPRMKAGQLSKPITGEKGYYLILMREQQKELTSTDVEAWLVSQLLIPKEHLISVMTEIQKKPDCTAFNELAQKVGLKGSGPMEPMIVARMPEQLYQVLKDVEVGQIKGPIEAEDFYLFFMKCKSKIVSILPDEQTIKSQLEMSKMEDISQNMLKDLRKNAVIEKK